MRYRLNPGDLRHRVTFQRLTNTQNDYGELEKIWIDVMSPKVGIYPISGKEFFSSEKVNSEVTHKIKMRYRPGITSDMRIKFGERIFEITSPPINFQELNVELQLMCKELI